MQVLTLWKKFDFKPHLFFDIFKIFCKACQAEPFEIYENQEDAVKRNGFHFGVVHYASFPDIITGSGPIAATLEKIIQLDDVQVVEITWVKDKEEREKVKNLLHSWKGIVVYSGAPILALTQKSLCSLDDHLRNDSVEMGKEIIDQACEFRASSVLLTSGPDPGSQGRNKARTLLTETLDKLLNYANVANDQLMVTLEPADRTLHRRQLIGPISESMEVVKNLKGHHPNFGLTIDMSHLAQLGEDKRQALRIARGAFRHVHIANAIIKNRDNPRFGDEHPRFGIEDGEYTQESIVEFLRDLKRIDFFPEEALLGGPIVSIEIKPDKDGDPYALMIESIDTFLKACLAA
jgi:sugar phosphate isomerase/epimerase